MSDSRSSNEVGAVPFSRDGWVSRRVFGSLLALPTPVIFLAAAALAIGLLWRRGSLGDIGTSLHDVHPAAALAILLAYASSIMVLGFRWHTLARIAGGAPAWTSSAEVFLTSVIVNYAAPIGLAVPTRAALTVRDLGLTPAQSGAVVAWEASLDIAALTAISTVWLALGGSTMLQSTSVDGLLQLLGAVILASIILAIVVVARTPGIRTRLAPMFRRMLTDPVQRPALTVIAVTLTAAFWVTQVGVMAGLLAVFGTSPTPSLLLGVMGLPVLIGMLSPVPGGAGVREALMAAAARLEGVPAGPVVLAAVAYRLALFVVTPLVWGIVRLVRARITSH